MIGERIKKFRKKLNITQVQFADTLGLTQGTIARFENGTREPDLKTIKKMSYVLDVTTDDIIFGYNTIENRFKTAGEYLRFLRESNGVTKEKLSELIGIEPDKVSKVENNLMGYSIKYIKTLSNVLGVPESYIDAELNFNSLSSMTDEQIDQMYGGDEYENYTDKINEDSNNYYVNTNKIFREPLDKGVTIYYRLDSSMTPEKLKSLRAFYKLLNEE